ncbi:MAG: hypothetical protein Q7S00_03345 [bacterium]|nr:hypothetical protein [bacterium]
MFLWTPAVPAAESCPDWPEVFRMNRAETGSGKKVLIFSFQNKDGAPEDEWLTDSFRYLLADYFSFSKKLTVLNIPDVQAAQPVETKEALDLSKNRGADYLLYGFFKRDLVKGTLTVFVRFTDVQKNKELGRAQWEMEYPKTEKIFDLYIEVADQAFQFFAGKKNEKKRLLPFRHESRSVVSFQDYILARRLVETGEPQNIETAVRLFGEALQNDYNYAPAYLGRAEALLMHAYVAKTEGKAHRALVRDAEKDLTKASLLHPAFTEKMQGTIQNYLKADPHQVAGLALAQENNKKAQNEFKKGLSFLPGDVLALRYLGESKKLKTLDPCLP